MFQSVYVKFSIEKTSSIIELIPSPPWCRMYPALTSSTEPSRLLACLTAAVMTSRSLVTGGTDFPEGPKHVLPLLNLLLPGIDPNDVPKTMVSAVLY